MKRRRLAPDRAALAAEIAGLSKTGITNLRERWKDLYGKQPSGALGRSFLIRAIAYRLQEKVFGGLASLRHPRCHGRPSQMDRPAGTCLLSRQHRRT